MLHALLLTCLAALLPQEPAAPVPPVAMVVRGVVLDGDMKPASGIALAIIDDYADGVAAALAQPLARSAADGAFTLDVPPPPKGHRWLVIGGGHFATMMSELMGWRSTPLTIDLGPFALAPGTSGAGRVRDASGAPIAGARV